MTRILVIPDVHSRSFWKDSVDKYKDEVDKIIFLGDYVDPYPNENITRRESIQILEDVLELAWNHQEKVVTLIGNHDAHYFLKNFPRSTRFDSSHAHHLREIYLANAHLLKLAHEETVNDKKFLFTHAGLMRSWAERNRNVIGEPTVDSLNKLTQTQQGIKALSDISRYRTWMGEPSGSILWSDVREKIDNNSSEDNILANEDSIHELYDFQIFGHTQLAKDPIITDKWACLDCRKAFVISEEGKLIEA